MAGDFWLAMPGKAKRLVQNRSAGRVGDHGTEDGSLTERSIAKEEGGGFLVYQTQLRPSCALSHFNLTRGLGSQRHYHKVTDEETEVWRGEVTCL